MSRRRLPNIALGSEPNSSDIEEDNLNENLNEFERNILIDEELNINRSQSNISGFAINTTKPSHTRRTPTMYHDSGILYTV